MKCSKCSCEMIPLEALERPELIVYRCPKGCLGTWEVIRKDESNLKDKS